MLIPSLNSQVQAALAGQLGALCSELTGQAPEWVQLLPAGPEIRGRDGRAWLFDDKAMAGVLAAFNTHGAPLPLDWEHATEVRAAQGLDAPAAGWITELEDRSGALWGRVQWTERAKAQVEAREYRFLSPVFLYRPADGRIIRMTSVGLTNTPNLRLTALNREHRNLMEDEMPKWLLEMLGLSQEATEDQVKAALNKLNQAPDLSSLAQAPDLSSLAQALGVAPEAKPEELVAAANKLKESGPTQEPDLRSYVPRADYEATVQRLERAENTLNQHLAAQQDVEIETEIKAAMAAGKIVPATAGYYRAQCRTENGLAAFREFVKAAPSLGDPADLPGKPSEGGAPALNREQQAVAAMMGNTAEDLAKYGR